MAAGNLKKMTVTLESPVKYELQLGDDLVNINDLIGQHITFNYTGLINCKNCGRKTKKSFAQGFCYPCFNDSPANSPCIIKPELCEGHLGKGRDVEWEQKHHVQPHVVYLALSSGLKVGVTRGTQVPTRWIDQGAFQAIQLANTPNRYLAGAIEVFLKDHMSDRTNWQRMLKNQIPEGIDLQQEKEKAIELLPAEYNEYIASSNEVVEINYPVTAYPEKVKSLNFDKLPTIEGCLSGIKGQYLIFDDGRVLNIRKFTGYWVELNRGEHEA